MPVALAGVSFPDILWALLVFSRIEEVRVDPSSPLHKYLVFVKYPFSHSLVVTNVLSSVIGAALALVMGNPYVLLVFVLGSISHWVLDVFVHLKDLPLLGIGKGDRTFGFGLWKRGRLAFAVEYAFYIVVTVLVVPLSAVPVALLLGAVFHLLNANSFLGFTRKNPFDSSSYAYATITLAGFVLFSLSASIMV